MGYLALYRKYRPQTFEEIVGQQNVVKILKNSIEKDMISHAYLFSGPRGTGKTTIAKLILWQMQAIKKSMISYQNLRF